MIDAQEQILKAATKFTAWEKAKAELEAVKAKVADLKAEYEDEIAACEEVGLTKAKAKKAVQGIVDVFVGADLLDLPAEKPKTPRKPRTPKAPKVEETAETVTEETSSETASPQEADASTETVTREAPAPVIHVETDEGVVAFGATTGDETSSEAVSDETDAGSETSSVEETVSDDEADTGEQFTGEVVSDDVQSDEEFGVSESSEAAETPEKIDINAFVPADADGPAESSGGEVPKSTFTRPAFLGGGN